MSFSSDQLLSWGIVLGLLFRMDRWLCRCPLGFFSWAHCRSTPLIISCLVTDNHCKKNKHCPDKDTARHMRKEAEERDNLGDRLLTSA